MDTKDIDRKIAVIFATDAVGYSKHMEKDENQTIQSFETCNEIRDSRSTTMLRTSFQGINTSYWHINNLLLNRPGIILVK